MTTYTPMIQQYLAVKAEVPDAFLFFRLGDFYEMFFDDAILAAKELEITLTGRGGGAEERIPMCGVPYHSAEGYIARLIEKGYKVAICEQMEDPATTKGMVRREIVRIVTPGTLMDGKQLADTANNYIAGAAEADGRFGFAVCDITTGELQVTSVEAMARALADELFVFSPAELIGDEALLAVVKPEVAGLSGRTVMTSRSSTQSDRLDKQFAQEETDRLDSASRLAVNLLLAYLEETQKRTLTHITKIKRYEPNHYMMMDPFTRRNLELVETVRDRSRKGSLLWLLDDSVTALGGRMLRKWIEKPLMQPDKIEERLEAVDCLYRQLIVRDDLRGHLRDVYDLERLVGRISYGNANARDMRALCQSLQQLPALRAICRNSGSMSLRRLVEHMDDCADVAAWIDETIVDEPPVSVRDGGMIREGYHDYLDQLRDADKGGKQWLAELEQRERELTGVKSLKVGYNKVFGYYIEVTRANSGQLPEGRYERKQTLANAERYITPELKEREALILEAQEKMVDIEYGLFAELRDKIADNTVRLQQLADMIGTIDALQSLASVSAKQRYKRPVLTERGSLRIVKGRHPVVEAVMSDAAFIDNDTRLSDEDGFVMLITGPNMAGKSTYMRQVAMICIMAQIGCFVPAEEAVIPMIDRIFTRIGAADDLIGGQSTFMVEMMDIQVMTEKATKDSLVIIDELGRGTSTGEGMAIAQAVIEYMHDRIGCKTLVSTHFHELAHLEETLGRLRNYCMAVKESGRQVTFLRRLVRGAASTSYGIYCAQIAGLPDSIIDRSYTLLSAFEAKTAVWQKQTDASDGAGGSGESGQGVLEAAAAHAPLDVQQLSARDLAAEQPQLANIADVEARVVEPAPAPVPGQAVQLALFEEPDASSRGRRKGEAKAEQVLEQLRNADLINMTPLQAMNLIYEMKQKLHDNK